MTIPLKDSQVTDKELARYAALVYEKTGIRLSPQKKTLLSNRIRRRLRETGIADFTEYFELLQRQSSNSEEWNAFLQEITTHETYLFRDEPHWDWFRNDFLPGLAARQPAGGGLRIWSAAASTGDEAMTIACCIADCLPDRSRWRVQIVGSDIAVGALEQARSGLFGERAMRLVPEDYKQRFFKKAIGVDVWQAKPILTGMITFKQHNLIHPIKEPPFDLVLLKNVLIYFDAASKARVMKNLLDTLRPGGLLLAGAAEGVSDLVKHLDRVSPWLFRTSTAGGGNQ